MNNQEPISIVAITDNHYMIMLAAMCKSIEKRHKTGEPLHFYLVSDGVSKSNKRKLMESFSSDKISFFWINVKDAVPQGTRLPLDKSTYPLTIYLRLFIPYFLPASVEKAIYMDVDMIVMEEISTLWNIDLGANPCAAVQDRWVRTVSHSWAGIRNYKELGLHPDSKYFNSGLMVFNVKVWRELNIADKVFKFIEDNKKVANFPDQYGLNGVLANQWIELDERWNYVSYGDLKYPYIIHFVQRKPFYKTYEFNMDYRDRFYEYVNATKWKGAKPVSESGRYIKKVKNVVAKINKLVNPFS